MTERFDIGQRFPLQHDFSGEILGGRYHLDRRIGCGGMATIYSATDQTTRGIVAVKVLHPEFDKESDLVRRFTQEGQLAAQIRHPNLVAANDLGWVGGRHFIVMQLVEGERLSDVTRERPLPWERSVGLVLDVLAALAALHARGVAHRDVSPHNCLIERLDDGARVRLLDLGNARVIAETDLMLTEIEASETMIVWGTSRYIDPDRLRGGPGDCRADIFSVGALWYTMLTGKTLPDPFELDPTAVLDRVPLPRRLLAVLRGALDKRDRRHHTARSMAEAIKGAMQGDGSWQRTVRAWWLVPAASLAFPAWLTGLHAAPLCEDATTAAASLACAGHAVPAVPEPVKIVAVSQPASTHAGTAPIAAHTDEPSPTTAVPDLLPGERPTFVHGPAGRPVAQDFLGVALDMTALAAGQDTRFVPRPAHEQDPRPVRCDLNEAALAGLDAVGLAVLVRHLGPRVQVTAPLILARRDPIEEPAEHHRGRMPHPPDLGTRPCRPQHSCALDRSPAPVAGAVSEKFTARYCSPVPCVRCARLMRGNETVIGLSPVRSGFRPDW